MPTNIITFPGRQESVGELPRASSQVKFFITDSKKLGNLGDILNQLSVLLPEYSFFLGKIRTIIQGRISGKRESVGIEGLDVVSFSKFLRNTLDPNLNKDFLFSEVGKYWNNVDLHQGADASYNAYFLQLVMLQLARENTDVSEQVLSIVSGTA